jgi:hypothetical protein
VLRAFATAATTTTSATGRAPLRLNLQRQYLLKEYLEMHGGHGPNATAVVRRRAKTNFFGPKK